MKKRKLIFFVILCSSIIIAGLMGMLIIRPVMSDFYIPALSKTGYSAQLSNSPLDKYDFANCKVSIHGYADKTYKLTEEQRRKFIEMLSQLDIYKYGLTEIPEFSGTPVPFEVEFENGERIRIHHVGGPYLVIADKAYKCYNDEALSRLDNLGRAAYRENYPDKD